mgnify:CR=1 FL=1
MTAPNNDTPRAASVWSRFWSPASVLEPVPADAGAQEREAIKLRNNTWLKTYMDIYILRWGVLWAACMVLTILAWSDAVPGVLFALAGAAAVASLLGLASMILIYRRAARALQGPAPGR